jgi:hypothetical protein
MPEEPGSAAAPRPEEYSAIITWGLYDAILTCVEPGKTEGRVPQRLQIDPKAMKPFSGRRIQDGTVEWSFRVR